MTSVPPPSETAAGVQVRGKLLLWSLAAINFTHIVDFMIMMPLGPELTRLFWHFRCAVWLAGVGLFAGGRGLRACWRPRSLTGSSAKRALLFCMPASPWPPWGAAWRLGMSLMCSRVAAGVFGGVLGALVQTIVGDAIPFERRGRAMGVVMSAFSLSTVAGVPLSLWLATQGGWHLPFLAIAAASLVIGLVAVRSVPVLSQHLGQSAKRSAWVGMRRVFSEANHWRAFALSCLMMAGSFSIIPYITIYTTTNVGLRADQVPLIYLAGVATLFTARLWGWMSDRWGKVATFRLVSALAAVPMMAFDFAAPVPLWMVLVVTTAFFVFVSGRMVPGMALLTAAPQASMRGAFMSANGALQSVTMGCRPGWVAA